MGSITQGINNWDDDGQAADHAVRRLMEEFGAEWRSRALSRLRSDRRRAMDEDDLVQEAFVALAQALRRSEGQADQAQFENRSKIRNFINRVIFRKAVTHARKSRRVRGESVMGGGSDSSSSSRPMERRTGNELDPTEMAIVTEVLESLDEQERDVVERWLDGQSLRSIAEELSVTIWSVRCVLAKLNLDES